MNSSRRPAQRYNVVGTSGSGKSTFAKQLAARLASPCIEMDALFWGPDWSSATDEAFFKKLHAALDQSSWVLDGNYTRTVPIKWARVQTVVWIDFSFGRTLYQAIRRALLRSLSGEELWPGTGNTESFAKSFLSRDSIILYTVRSYWKNRRKYEAAMRDPNYCHIDFVRLTSPKAVINYLNELSNA